MLKDHISEYQGHAHWLDRHRQDNERHVATARKAFKRAMKELRLAGIIYRPYKKRLSVAFVYLGRVHGRCSEAGVEEISTREAHMFRMGANPSLAAKRMDEQTRAGLHTTEEARARHRE